MRKRSAKEVLRDNGGRNAKLAIITVMILIGSAMMVYNADTLYLAGKESLTSSYPPP